MGTIKKRAADLRVGDKIVGNTNWWVIKQITPSTLTGWSCPIIHVEDRNGLKKTIDTGGNERLQDHLYEVEVS